MEVVECLLADIKQYCSDSVVNLTTYVGYQLNFFSIAIAVVIVISYIIISHNTLSKIVLHHRDLISVIISVIV